MSVLAAREAGRRGHPVWLTYQWELEKLSAQFRTRLALALSLLGPLAFVLGLRLSASLPSDTLFGRWAAESGYADALVILGFGGSWVFPLLTCLIAGDIFSAEDHYRTWTTILTRSASRRGVFTGKVLATMTYAVVVIAFLALSSLTCGVLLIGHQELVGLSGNVLHTGTAARVVLLSWSSVLPAVLAIASLGILVSIATRNSLSGIVVPAIVGLGLQLLMFVGGIDGIRLYLPNASFVAWHGLFAAPSFDRPVLFGIAAAFGYLLIFLSAAWALFRRRDMTGA